ncbi:hypothetical protein P5673_012297 [Acropora cervicornis]|uniref:Uncharacterized protein n=1 Tax=Acropora cervicornis TaxID=6130 RepID=A0AAD9V7E2_ACRCE|nr:hypothetical protein P5673_012297 [Acropora cervicornis]
MFQHTVDDRMSFKSLLQHNTVKVINQHRQRHSVRIQNPTTELWDPAIVTQKLAEPTSFGVEAGNGATHRRNRRHINTIKEVFAKKHGTEDGTEALSEDTAVTIPAPPQRHLFRHKLP